jgi:hypothetical protein
MMFSLFPSLKSITVPASVTVIHAQCFHCGDPGVSQLATVLFEPGSKLRTIGAMAFENCFLLKSICLPVSVEFLDGGAFMECGLSRIDFEPGNAVFHSVGDFVMDLQNIKIIRYFGTDQVVQIADEIEILGPRSFGHCHLVLEVRFSPTSHLHLVDSFAFVSCPDLQSISFPPLLASLNERSFSGCVALRSVSFDAESKLRLICQGAFFGCQSLSSIAIPASVEILEQKCFAECSALAEVSFAPDSKLLRIDSAAFMDCSSLPSLVIPSSVEVIGEWCFRHCSALSSFTFVSPSHCFELDDVPRNCEGLIAIPDAVELLIFYSLPGVTFGRDSHLKWVWKYGDRSKVVRCFLQTSSHYLKVFRSDLEFGESDSDQDSF